MRITEYFWQLENMIDLFPIIQSKSITCDTRSEFIGFIQGILYFNDGSTLHIKEFVNVEGEINRYKYGYHFMQGKEIVFRYDNANDPRTHELITYPHHKHQGDIILESQCPTLEDVLLEIADIIEKKEYF